MYHPKCKPQLPERQYLVQKPVEPNKVRKNIDFVNPGARYFTKYDGIHTIVVKDEDGECFTYSRTGEYLPSLYHLANRLLKDAKPNMVYFAEAWSPQHTFPEISGLVRRLTESVPVGFTLQVFDCVTLAGFCDGKDDRPWTERWADVPQNLRATELVFSGYTLDALYKMAEWVQRGQDQFGPVDGVILRWPPCGWVAGPATNGAVVKIKPRMTFDLEVIGTTPGKGIHNGRIGALVVKTGANKHCEVGTGLTHADRELDFTGKIVQVACLGVNKSGKLREPSFQGIRFDKDKPDLPADNTET